MKENPDYPRRLRLWLLVINFLPCAHVLAMAAVLLGLEAPVGVRAGVVTAMLYLAPPILARIFLRAAASSGYVFPVDSRGFLAWWTASQLQALFNRFPVLEEALRVIPGFYSGWLRLWGSRIGRLTFWSPGTRILDRGQLEIGDDVVFGAGVRLSGHVLRRNADGQLELILAPIRIGANAVIGAYSLIAAGAHIAAGESTRAHLLLSPFTIWRDGKRVRQDKEEWHHHDTFDSQADDLAGFRR